MGKMINLVLSILRFRKWEEKKDDVADRHSGIMGNREVKSRGDR